MSVTKVSGNSKSTIHKASMLWSVLGIDGFVAFKCVVFSPKFKAETDLHAPEWTIKLVFGSKEENFLSIYCVNNSHRDVIVETISVKICDKTGAKAKVAAMNRQTLNG
jgi:hypothetical protein